MSASGELSNKMNYWWGFHHVVSCFCSTAGASQLATRKAPGARGIRGGLPLLWRRHRPRAGRQTGALWSRLSRNQQGERQRHWLNIRAQDSQVMLWIKTKDALFFSCRRWTLWSVRFSCWRICVTSGSFSTMVVFGTSIRRSSPFLSSSCLGCVLLNVFQLFWVTQNTTSRHKPSRVWLRHNMNEDEEIGTRTFKDEHQIETRTSHICTRPIWKCHHLSTNMSSVVDVNRTAQFMRSFSH